MSDALARFPQAGLPAHPGRSSGWALAATGALLVAAAAPARAQSVDDAISDLAAFANIGKGLQTIAVLGQTPGVSNTKLDGDDLEIDAGRIHLSHRFNRRNEAGERLASPFVEITLGRSKATESIAFVSGRPDDFELDVRFRARSILVGGGITLPLGSNTRVTPMVLAGHSRLKINSRYTGLDADEFFELYEGLLNRGKIESTLLGGAIELDHRSMVGGSFLTLNGRYNHFFNVDDDVTDRGLEPRGTAGVATAMAQLEVPTKLTWGERELFVGGMVRGVQLVGAGRNQFGFNNYVEAGGSLVFDYRAGSGIAFGVQGSVLRGSGVKGHSFGIVLKISGDKSAHIGR